MQLHHGQASAKLDTGRGLPCLIMPLRSMHEQRRFQSPMTQPQGISTPDPRPEVPRLVELTRRVLSGEIVLPKFQRPYTWNREQILKLLDSIARNYPIGSVLLWQSDENYVAERTVGDVVVNPPRPGFPMCYILDGQQRLSTVCGALHWSPDGDADSPWNIVYDLSTESFEHRATLDDPPAHQIPLRLLSDPSKYFPRTSEIVDDEVRQRAVAFFDRLRDYALPTITLHGMAKDEVAKVFERINSTGTQLDMVDLVRAATWKPDFDLSDEIDQLLGVLDEKHYGHVDRKTMLRTISAAAGFGFANQDMDRLRELSKTELEAAVASASEAARRAVDFCTTQIGTPRAAALPYGNQFAVLVEIFRQLPKPSSEQFAAIHRWFWLTAAGGYFKGWRNNQMAADREAVTEFAAGRAPTIDVAAPRPQSNLWRRTPFRRDSPAAKVLTLMLSYARPVDLRTGQYIDTGKALSWSNDKEFHHFFPKDFLTTRQRYSAEQANACANLIMLSSVSNIWISNQATSGYLRALCDDHGKETIRARLTTCLVNDEAFEAALHDDYGTFLEVRAETLQEHLDSLIDSGGTAHPVATPATDGTDPDAPEPVDRDSAD